MNENLHLGPKGEALIKSFETCVLKAYPDTHNKDGSKRYACGWGHTGSAGPPEVTADTVFTQEQADAVFRQDMEMVEAKVRQHVKAQLNQNQFDALCSAAYNMRTAHFEEAVRLSNINGGAYSTVPAVLMLFDKSDGRVLRGLTRRRKEEGELFSAPVIESADNA